MPISSKQTSEQLMVAEGMWRREDPLNAGEALYENIEVLERPAWAVAVLDACCAGRAPPREVQAVREIALTRSRWPEAHDAFSAVRQLVLAEERGRRAIDWTAGVLYLAETVAKVTYNASGAPAPFDHNAGWWVAKNARRIVDIAKDETLLVAVWSALSRLPNTNYLSRLAADSYELSWVSEYWDGALSGALVFNGKTHWFEYCVEAPAHRRRYTVHELSDAEIEEEQRWHSLFLEHVGDHGTFKDDRSRGTLKPRAEWAKFYDAYATRAPVDYSRNRIVGVIEM